MATTTTTRTTTTNTNTASNYVMTPALLTQLWQSYGGSRRVQSLTMFSQKNTKHEFSNYSKHFFLKMEIPGCCNPKALSDSGRPTTIGFDFAEKAIMACKAALFRDYPTFDAIMASKDSKEAKSLGRKVKPFDQQTWDACQCGIVRDVMVAKLQWKTFEDSLLRTGNDTIAECTAGDWVWGTALDLSDSNVWFPGRWTGRNILGWSLMEARDEAQQQLLLQQQQQQQQQLLLQPLPSAPPASADTLSSSSSSSSAAAAAAAAASGLKSSDDETIDPNSIKYLATLYSFGPNAFGPLQQSNQNSSTTTKQLPDISHLVKGIIEASVPEAKTMRGERGRKPVTRMLTDIYLRGLFMHGGPNSSVNSTVVPAMRHVMAELHKLETKHKKRVTMARELAEACLDCQQVQARVILRLYADLTSQNETLESQLKYSLVRIKEAALHVLISKYHSPFCDYDHTMVGPEQQRAHLWSGYVTLVGNDFGLDGITAANGDRFLNPCLDGIWKIHNERLNGNNVVSNVSNQQRQSGSMKRFRFGGSRGTRSTSFCNDQKLKDSLMDELTKTLCVKEWLSGLIGDINNQADDADRMIDRSCIFQWASSNMKGDFKHRIFYDDARSQEYSDLDPKEPTQDNQYEPFLSPVVLVEMLLQAGMLIHKPSGTA